MIWFKHRHASKITGYEYTQVATKLIQLIDLTIERTAGELKKERANAAAAQQPGS